MRIESDNERRDTERPDTTRLSIFLRCVLVRPALKVDRGATHLLDSSNVASNVFHRNGILNGQAMALAFYPCFVDENSAISSQTYEAMVNFMSLT